MFPYSYRITSESLENTRKASVSTLFRVLPNFHGCFYNCMETRKKKLFSISFIKQLVEN